MVRIAVLLLSFSLLLFSCKKKCGNKTASLSETNWDIYFKNNSTFTFYAVSHAYFKANDSISNYRNFDTLNGTWEQNNAQMTINFNNGDIYSGTLITADSISGTLTASGNDGVWYALKK